MANKTIAKNTIFLYFRMMFTMIVSLYTSRVVLQTLGVNDYGIYQTVGGVAGILQFIINGSLAFGSSRFITYEIGKGDKQSLRKTFSSLLTIHIFIGLVVLFLAETIGLWFVYNKLVIPDERFFSAVIVFHISIISSLVGITQVPYTAVIIGHERMRIYAYMSIVEALLKLFIVYLLVIGNWDKLILYSFLLFAVQLLVALSYRFYCIHHFEESKYYFVLDWQMIKKILGFSTWNLVENTSISLNAQGTIILLNMFFSSAVVTARSVANIVTMAANSFVGNFRTAVNPQIIKKYSVGDYNGSKHLLLMSTLYSFFLMLILAVPIFFVAEPLLRIWLGQVPEYSVMFLRFSIITALIGVFEQSFYTAFTAKGEIRESTIWSVTIGYLTFPVVYVLFKLGFSPVSLAWAMLLSTFISACIIKPLLLIRRLDYGWKELVFILLKCLIVSLVSLPLPLYVYKNQCVFANPYVAFICIVLISILSVAVSIWFLGLPKETRSLIICKILSLNKK